MKRILAAAMTALLVTGAASASADDYPAKDFPIIPQVDIPALAAGFVMLAIPPVVGPERGAGCVGAPGSRVRGRRAVGVAGETQSGHTSGPAASTPPGAAGASAPELAQVKLGADE